MTSKDLAIEEPIASEIVAWLARNCGNYYTVEMNKVAAQYEVHIRWSDGQTQGPWQGPTLREALVEAMAHFDQGSLDAVSPLSSARQVRVVPLDEPTGIVDTMDNALLLDVKWLPKDGMTP